VLGKINQYCFSGNQGFENEFRVLVAGGGTGDAAIYLAEQLRDRSAKVVYLDISRTSMAIAQQRASVRRLENIQWHQGSLLDLEPERFGKFDYINCAGVLHHLKEPGAGLRALTRVLKDDGAMGLMLYGLAGRQDIYLAQQLMRLVNRGEHDLARQVAIAQKMLASLPASNWLMRGRDRFELIRQFENDPADVIDTFLHVQDQAYSVGRVYELVEDAGLELLTFTSFHMAGNIGTRLEYAPRLYVRDAELLARISSMPTRVRQEIAELMSSAVSLHSFYAARQGERSASFLDERAVPFFLTETGRNNCRALAASPSERVSVSLRPGIKVTIDPGSQTRALLARVDDKRCMRDIASAVRADTGVESFELENRTLRDLEDLAALDWLALRGPEVRPFPMLCDVAELHLDNR
jgi:2-polyprenyl-3-methyl-5-hydroxy-6-metoxy-1,4-benzoquinol methylase